MGVPEDELVHVRRGAMLHDIGKIAVPDAILAKPGPLDDAEWRVMRRHPTVAYEMLQPISFLGPALEIPYCHHERWDGSGYPRGLKGEQIPATARMFAVVDVWDALTHDRPYRAAWPEDRARAHIRSAAGKHLDPHAVEEFLAVASDVKELRQEIRHFRRVPGPVGGGLGHQLDHEVVQHLGNLGDLAAGPGRRLVQVGVHQDDRRVPIKRRLAYQHLVEHNPECIEVGLVADGRRAADLLGGDVAQSPQDPPAGGQRGGQVQRAWLARSRSA